MSRIDLATLEREVASLFEAYPELAEDEDLRAGMLEGSTDVMDVLARLVAQTNLAALAWRRVLPQTS